MEYAEFEGRIPEGGYGAGTVIVWDAGTYENVTERAGQRVPVEKAIDDGHVKVWLKGQKLHGAYALTRMRTRDEKQDWLLIKVDDEGADRRRNPVTSQPESVISGRTNKEFAEET